MRSKAFRVWLIAFACSVLAPISLFTQDRDDWGRRDNTNRSQYIHANVSGGTGNGKCTFEVVVYGVADVLIRGDEGRLVSIDGAPAEWRRLDCNQPLPTSAKDFHFSGVDGHGKQFLEQNPGGNDGVAVIRIDNTVGEKAGKAEGYTGDITWKGRRYSDNTFHGDHGWNTAPTTGTAAWDLRRRKPA